MSYLLRNNNGSVSVAMLTMVVVLIILGGTFASVITIEMRNTDRQVRKTKTFYIAEAGISRAWSELKSTISDAQSLDSILAGDEGFCNTWNENFGEGKYQVKVIDNDDGDENIYSVISTGTLGEIRRTIRVAFSSIFYTDKTILTGGDLEIGDTEPSTTDEILIRNINGENNNHIHTNGDLTANEGSETKVHGDITTSGNVIQGEDIELRDKNGNTPTTGGSPYVPVPEIDPEFYRPLADHILSGNQTFDETSDVVNWDTYFVDGDITLTGEIGSTTVLHVTIIATGNIEVSGEVKIHASIPNLLLVAGENITIGGEPKLNDGAILAHHRIDIIGGSGTTQEIKLRNGVIIAENADGSSNHITGELTITTDKDAEQVQFSTKDIRSLSWH